MNLRQWFIDFFGFSKKEANGILILFVLILLLAILPRFYFLNRSTAYAPDSLALQVWYDQLTSMRTSDSIRQLTFTEYSKIQRRTDVGKKRYTESKKKPSEVYGKLPQPHERDNSTQSFFQEDINKATAEELMTINGIGPVLSERIVKYRDRLGGFYKMEQLKNVYGLEPEVVEKVKARFEIQSPAIKSLFINSDSLKLIATHPLMDYKIARSIVNFRKTHGDYTDPSQLREIKGLTDSLYQKIYPYISIGPPPVN